KDEDVYQKTKSTRVLPQFNRNERLYALNGKRTQVNVNYEQSKTTMKDIPRLKLDARLMAMSGCG
ncbi:hypothetical protein Tco_1221882, partial [Tanacetum coccineum]